MTFSTGLTIAQEDAIYDWIYAILNPFSVNIDWAYSDELQPGKPFCILNVISRPRMEHRPSIEYNSVDTIDYRFHNVFTLSVNIYSDSGNDYVRRVIKSQHYESTINLLKREGLCCRYETAAFFMPKVVSDRFEFRESVDFIMACSEIDQEVTGEIRSVELTGTLQGTVDQIDIIKNWTIST